jgi:hypothetical protein
MVAPIHAARSDFVQFGLPNVGSIFIDQYDFSLFSLTQGFSKSSSQFKPARSASHHHDAMQVIHIRHKLLKNIILQRTYACVITKLYPLS